MCIIGKTVQFSSTPSCFILETLRVIKRSRFLQNSVLCIHPFQKNFAPIYLSRGRGRVNSKKVSRTRQHSAFLPFPEERLKKKKKKERERRKEGKKFALNKQKPSFTPAEPFPYLPCGNLMIKMTVWEGGGGRKMERNSLNIKCIINVINVVAVSIPCDYSWIVNRS